MDTFLKFMNLEVGILKTDMFTSEKDKKKRKKWVSYKQNKKTKGIYGVREARVCKIVKSLFGCLGFKSVRPDFLRYKNGKNLELDFYNSDLKLAIEVQGRQHYEYIEKFHKTEEEFLEQRKRDQFKRDMCSVLGICLIEIPYWVDLDDIKEFILRNMKLVSN